MKVCQIQGCFGIESVQFADRPDPKPGPGQVLLRMRAWSLNYRDLMLVRGTYHPKLRMPFVLLSDGVGEVAALGEGVTRVKAGDRVAGAFMQTWIDAQVTDVKSKSALGGSLPGVAAEMVVLDAEGVVPVPAHLSDEEAATLPCAAVTAWHALTGGSVQAGQTVLLQGTGGVSLFALQFAHLMGARIIITSSSDEKLQRARQMGASECINYKTTPDWSSRVRELTGGEGVDHVVEVGGAGTFVQSLNAVRMGGRVNVIGVLSGFGQVDPVPILMKSAHVQGIYVGSRAMFEQMNAAISLHQVRPVVDHVFPWTEIQSALRHLESGSHFGKIVLRR